MTTLFQLESSSPSPTPMDRSRVAEDPIFEEDRRFFVDAAPRPNRVADPARLLHAVRSRLPEVVPQTRRSVGMVQDALLGFCVAHLNAGLGRRGYEYVGSESLRSAHRWTDILRSRGLPAEAIARHEFGLFPSAAEVHEYLTNLGFTGRDINFTLLDEVEAGSLILPLYNTAGRVVDLACLSPRENADRWRRVGEAGVGEQLVYGHRLNSRAPRHVVLVEDPVEACRLRDVGLGEATAILNWNDVRPGLFSELSVAGVERVTCIAPHRSSQFEAMRSAAVRAEQANATPAVDLFEMPASAGRFPSDYATRVGAAEFHRWISGSAEWPAYTEPARDLRPVSEESPAPLNFWQAVRPSLDGIRAGAERRDAERLAGEVESDLRRGHFESARRRIGAACSDASYHVPEADRTAFDVTCVQTVRVCEDHPAEALREQFWSLMETTADRVTVVTPLTRTQFIELAVAGPRSTSVDRDRMETHGHRFHVVTTTQPSIGAARFDCPTRDERNQPRRTVLLDQTAESAPNWWQERVRRDDLQAAAAQLGCHVVAVWSGRGRTESTPTGSWTAAEMLNTLSTLVDTAERNSFTG